MLIEGPMPIGVLQLTQSRPQKKHANDQGSAQDKLLEALAVVAAWVSAYLGVCLASG